jgi:hypothetical protein
MQAQIRSTFGDDVRLLETIIGRDLSHWLTVPPRVGDAASSTTSNQWQLRHRRSPAAGTAGI